MNEETTDWGKSVTGVVIHNGKVLLARHTYGKGTGKLIIPGGYVNYNETPQHALVREFLEETGVTVEPEYIVGIRFNLHDWYVAFKAKYISGEPRSDNDENSEVLWLDCNEALQRDDVPELTKTLIVSTMSAYRGLEAAEYESNSYPPNSLYSIKEFVQ